MPSIGPHNPALGEIYQRLYPEMRRPKPNQEAIAAALQAMQRLTMESDSEAAAEDATRRLYLQLSQSLPRLWTSESCGQQVLRHVRPFPWNLVISIVRAHLARPPVTGFRPQRRAAISSSNDGSRR